MNKDDTKAETEPNPLEKMLGVEAGTFPLKNPPHPPKEVSSKFKPTVVDIEKTENEDDIRKKINEVFSVQCVEHKFDKRISERKDIIKTVLEDDFDYDIVARTGMGKTYALLHVAKGLKCKMVYLVPLQAQARQLKKEGFPALYEKMFPTDDMLTKPIIVAVYNSFEKLIKKGVDFKDYVLCVDEWHQFTSSANYRRDHIHKVIEKMGEFRKRIRVTGTPEAIFKNDEVGEFKPLKRIRFVSDKQKSKVETAIIGICQKADLNFLAYTVLHSRVSGKIIIMIDNKVQLEELRKIMVENYGIPEKEISTLTSVTKKENLAYKTITESTEQKIPDQITYLLCTSVMSDGVSVLNEDIETVYFFHNYNPIAVRQMVARFRAGVVSVVDIMPIEDYELLEEPLMLPDLKTYEAELKVFISTMAEKLNASETLCPPGLDILKELEYMLDIEIGNGFPMKFDGHKLEADEQLIKYTVLTKLHRVAMEHPIARKCYYELFEDWKVRVVNIDRGDVNVISQTEQKKLLISELTKGGLKASDLEDVDLSILKRLFRTKISYAIEGEQTEGVLKSLNMNWDWVAIQYALERIKINTLANPKVLFAEFKASNAELDKSKIERQFTEVITDLFSGNRVNRTLIHNGEKLYNNLDIAARKSLKENFNKLVKPKK